MNVGDLFQRLSFGELSNLSMSSEGNGTIREADQPKIISHANSALRRLYSVVTHKRDYVQIRLDPTIKRYALTGIHADSNTDPTNTAARYIVDSVDEPFQDDVLLILEVARDDDPDTDLNEYLASDPCVETLSYNTLMVHEPTEGQTLTVEYQAAHAPLSIIPDPTEEIFLASLLEEALEVEIARRIFVAMGGEDFTSRAQGLAARYIEIMNSTEIRDLAKETIAGDNDKFTRNGWR